jgi:DNA 3'-phosphatase
MSHLVRIAEEFNIAVVIINQCMADPGALSMFGPVIKPVGGHVLAHASTTRVMLKKGKGEQRIAKIFDGDELFETHILFVSNQGGLLKKKDGIGGFCSKIDKIRSTIGLPISFICAMDTNNMYRKPLPGMWEFFQAFMRYNYNELTASANNVDTKFNAEMLLFVGDAAGRAAEGTRKKDFSDSDLKFAMNVGTKVLMLAGPFIYLLIRLFLYSS